jgi:hypothetical protein
MYVKIFYFLIHFAHFEIQVSRFKKQSSRQITMLTQKTRTQNHPFTLHLPTNRDPFRVQPPFEKIDKKL